MARDSSEGLDQFDQGERVGAQVGERRVLGDLVGALLEDLGELIAYDAQNGGSVRADECTASAALSHSLVVLFEFTETNE